MRTVIYARKSSESEDRQVQSLEDQVRELTKLARREGILVAEVFQEAKSAKEPYIRPEFDRMIKEVGKGRISGILTWSPNRISRNSVDGGLVAHLLQTGKLDFIRTPERNYRPDDNALLMAIENGMATAFIQDLRRNVVRGMTSKVERGWHVFKAPIGYKNDPDSREIVIDEARFHLLSQGWSMIASGDHSVASVHRFLVENGLTVYRRGKSTRPVSCSAVYSIFRNRFYAGEVKFQGRSYKGKHIVMVSSGVFDKVQRLLDIKDLKSRRKMQSLPFAGALKCGKCGCNIVGEKKVKFYKTTGRTAEYVYYHCSGAKGCSKKSLSESQLMKKAMSLIESIDLKPEVRDWLDHSLKDSIAESLANERSAMPAIKKTIQSEEVRLAKLANMRIDGEISGDEYKSLKDQILSRIYSQQNRSNEAQSLNERIYSAIEQGLNVASKANELKSGEPDPFAVADVLRKSGNHILTLGTVEFRLFPITQKIAGFERLRKSSQTPKPGDFVQQSSIWWSQLNELRTCALREIEREDCVDATSESKRGAA